MSQKVHIENFLKLNGVPLDAPDEEIRTALQSARWAPEDVEEAIAVLHGKAESETIETIVSRQLFHSDEHVASETLSSLLGITVHVRHKGNMQKELEKSKQQFRTFFTYLIVCAFLAAAVGFAVFAITYIYTTSGL